MFNRPVRSIHDFLLSTYFADGLRITFGVLLPSLILAQFGLLKYGMTLSLGALCVSVVDTPGPIVHRRNAMLVTTVLITVLSVIVGLTNKNQYFIAVLLVACSFLFSMFFLYGTRAALVGTASLLIMVLSIDDVRPWKDVLIYSGLVFSGSLWYTVLSYFFYRLRPYRLVQQTLSDSIHEVSEFLRAKAKFYHESTNYDDNYAELIQLQVAVHEKQDAVREVLFKTREIVRESTPEGRFLLLVFVDMVDLYEQVMSTYYNYKQLHDQFDKAGILSRYERIINRIAWELDEIAFALKTGGTPRPPAVLTEDVKRLKDEINALEKDNTDGKYNTLGLIALKNIEVNIENIAARVKTINGYFNKKEKKNLKNSSAVDTERFITRQKFDAKLFFDNLTFSSSTFRHAMRVSIAMLIGYLVAKMLDSSHSYWILLTVLVISKPAFSLTKQRNYERLIGTVVGALIGMGILIYIHDKHTLFFILLFCMIGTYSFQRKNYIVSVLFMTPYILVLFDFLGMGSLSVARERIFDTLIGSAIALLGSYTLFPNWENKNLKEAMLSTLRANMAYFDQVTLLYTETEHNLTNYRLSRKEVYVTSANLSSIFQKMFSEPKSKQRLMPEMHQFTALNHLLSSYTATLSLYFKEHSFILTHPEDLKPTVNNTLYLLNLSVEYLIKNNEEPSNVPLIKSIQDDKKGIDPNEMMVIEQYEMIQKVAYDIFKLTERIKI
ncbi:putative membrane protein (TIGR01666 family) [Pedobacter cryoconitis]|uniref:Putative membrane protein (TIGR01666 family) n=1 Tax=Pedobacter cryoconitis TaxID=188932 RepID=A0A7W8YSZ3_9SPHI|nr:FUSC family membrane protein [Pedobacter cryoconitis]MBB5621122.1 putative membrane protein (TIGR01666 family) [Pedobacter cryoconitis]MBB5645566.1 putative membrane protein (TIGR01666 family) [Pedobacter cryoconitis]